MRIVLLTSKLNFKTAGGSVMDLHLKAKGLADLGHEVTVVTAFSYVNEIERTLPYRVHEELIRNKGLIGIQYHAYHILKKYASLADVLYIDGQIFLYAGGLYRLLRGRVSVVAFFNTRLNAWADTHGNAERISMFKKLKKTFRLFIEHHIGVPIANAMDAYIFNTPMLRQLYLDFGFLEAKSCIIEDFVDMKGIVERHRISAEFIEAHQKNQPTITFFSTGRMLREKGFDLIVQAFALLKNKDVYRVVLSGGGPDKERIEKLAESLGVSRYFTFPGWVDKDVLASYFTESHVFIFPKWWMEYGSALLTEALAFGLPCIIPGGGALEWLTEKNALTFPENNYKVLAQRMDEFGRDEALRIRFGLKSLARVSTLDASVLTKKLASVLTAAAHPVRSP